MDGETVLISVRPHLDVLADFNMIRDWAKNHDLTFNAIICSLLPAISYGLKHDTFRSKGKLYLRCQFGDVHIREKGTY